MVMQYTKCNTISLLITFFTDVNKKREMFFPSLYPNLGGGAVAPALRSTVYRTASVRFPLEESLS